MAQKDKKNATMLISYNLKNHKLGSSRKKRESNRFSIFVLEREPLLSSFPANPTVGSLRDKKESCSTQSRLRVDTEFEEF